MQPMGLAHHTEGQNMRGLPACARGRVYSVEWVDPSGTLHRSGVVADSFEEATVKARSYFGVPDIRVLAS